MFQLMFTVLFNPQVSKIKWITINWRAGGQYHNPLNAKSVGFNSPLLAAIERIKLSFGHSAACGGVMHFCVIFV